MAQEIKGFADHFDGFKRHLKLAAATFGAIVAIGVGFAYSLPDIYRSQGYVLIEEPEISEELIKSTVTVYATRQLTFLSEMILTVPTLIRIIEEFDLYSDERRGTPVELLAAKARQAIEVKIQSRDSVSLAGTPQLRAVGFTISFDDEDPETARVVAEELVALYLEANLKARSEQTSEAADFLKAEVKLLEDEVSGLEARLAAFKEKNADSLPALNSLNLQILNRIDGQLLQGEAELQSLQQVRIGVEAQLATVEPSMPIRLADGSIAMSPASQLKQLQTQLTIYQSRYSENHPDVVATKRDIESLKNRFGIDADLDQMDKELLDAKGQLAIAKEKYSPEHPDVVMLQRKVNELEQQLLEVTGKRLESKIEPDNPAYLQLLASLEKLDAEEAALKMKLEKFAEQLVTYESRLMETPQVERELAGISRLLQSAQTRYWQMRDKQFAADMGQTLETENKGEQMVLVEPPRLPLKPYKPNRGAIIVLAFLFALVAGVGITQLADSMDNAIQNAAAVLNVQGVPPLVEVPYIYTDEELAHVAKLKKMVLVSIVPTALLLAVIVHFTVLPLDVLWYSLARRIGL